MLHDLANDGGFVALKREAEDREGKRWRERMSQTCCTAKYYWWWLCAVKEHPWLEWLRRLCFDQKPDLQSHCHQYK